MPVSVVPIQRHRIGIAHIDYRKDTAGSYAVIYAGFIAAHLSVIRICVCHRGYAQSTSNYHISRASPVLSGNPAGDLYEGCRAAYTMDRCGLANGLCYGDAFYQCHEIREKTGKLRLLDINITLSTGVASFSLRF